MKSYIIPIRLEPDEDVWRAFSPDLESRGVAARGRTGKEALRNIQDVAQMVVEDLLNAGEPLPQGVVIWDGPAVAVNVVA